MMLKFSIHNPIGACVSITKIPLTKDRISDILSLVFNILLAKDNLNLDRTDFLNTLKPELENIQKQIPIEERVKSMANLIFANEEVIINTFKASESILNNSKNFRDVSIQTDIRPIFINNESTVLGVALIHKLKIIYKEFEEYKEVYFGLDNNDLDTLKEAIELAEKQIEKLKPILNTSIIQIK